MSNQVKILDCTLRDGGYYNRWDFDEEMAIQLVEALNASGVDMIELGYKSIDRDNYYGLFKYCNEELLIDITSQTDAEYAFMIDAKEFIHADGTIDKEGINEVVVPAENSLFSWVRIASHYATVEQGPDLTNYFQELGYKVCFNLMGGSLIEDQALVKALEILNPAAPEVFYIADSFGSFYPDDVRHRIRLIRKHFSGKIGVHLHDNQGMAYANALAALDEGVDIVDGTVTGMGRGAGNLLLEQFMLGYKERFQVDKIQPHRLLPVINQYFQPLKSQHQWGFNYVYMLSGLHNIHQTYCQTLSSTNRYSMSQVTEILEEIPPANRAKFKQDQVNAAVKRVLSHKEEIGDPLPVLPISPVDRVVIAAQGPSLRSHMRSIRHLLQQPQIQLTECNDTGLFEDQPQRRTVILNRPKLEKYLADNQSTHPTLITGESSVAGHKDTQGEVYHQPYRLAPLAINSEEVCVPDYDAGMYAIAIALRDGASEIYLAGFDGFEDAAQNAVMDDFFEQVNALCKEHGATIKAITPTRYQSLVQTSVYALL